VGNDACPEDIDKSIADAFEVAALGRKERSSRKMNTQRVGEEGGGKGGRAGGRASLPCQDRTTPTRCSPSVLTKV